MRGCCFIFLVVLAVVAAEENTKKAQMFDNSQDFIERDLQAGRDAYNLKEDFERKLNPWVAQELLASEEDKHFQATESFYLQLASSQEHEFRWSTKTKQKELQLMVRIFTQESGDDIVIIKNPSEDSRIDLYSKSSLKEEYQILTSIYLLKVVKAKLTNDQIFIKLKNTHGITVIVQVSIEEDPSRINSQIIAKNDNFKLPAEKLSILLQELRRGESNRRRLYKWQWGFLQREQHYESQMLKLTVAQLFIILATSIIQMYCIKSLFENGQII